MANRAMRVRAFSRLKRNPPGFFGYERVHVQQLQGRYWCGWRTLDEEIVPSDAIISAGCFGDYGGWKSKFSGLGSFGRDGKFTPHQSATA